MKKVEKIIIIFLIIITLIIIAFLMNINNHITNQAYLALKTTCTTIDEEGNYEQYEEENSITCVNYVCTIKYANRIYQKKCLN